MKQRASSETMAYARNGRWQCGLDRLLSNTTDINKYLEMIICSFYINKIQVLSQTSKILSLLKLVSLFEITILTHITKLNVCISIGYWKL